MLRTSIKSELQSVLQALTPHPKPLRDFDLSPGRGEGLCPTHLWPFTSPFGRGRNCAAVPGEGRGASETTGAATC